MLLTGEEGRPFVPSSTLSTTTSLSPGGSLSPSRTLSPSVSRVVGPSPFGRVADLVLFVTLPFSAVLACQSATSPCRTPPPPATMARIKYGAGKRGGRGRRTSSTQAAGSSTHTTGRSGPGPFICSKCNPVISFESYRRLSYHRENMHRSTFNFDVDGQSEFFSSCESRSTRLTSSPSLYSRHRNSKRGGPKALVPQVQRTMERPQQLQEARPRNLPTVDLRRRDQEAHDDDADIVDLFLKPNSASTATTVDRVPSLLHRRALNSFACCDNSPVPRQAVVCPSSTRGRLRSRSVDSGGTSDDSLPYSTLIQTRPILHLPFQDTSEPPRSAPSSQATTSERAGGLRASLDGGGGHGFGFEEEASQDLLGLDLGSHRERRWSIVDGTI